MRTLKINLLTFLSLFIFSCEGTYEEVGDSGGSSSPSKTVKSMTVSLPSGILVINTEIIFKVLSDSDEDITALCKFFVDGVEISGSKFTATKEGDYEVYCTYKELKSNTVTFTVNSSSESSKEFKSNVVVEDYTGTWCPFCPRIAYKLSELEKKTTQLIPVAVHDASGRSDPFHYDKAAEMGTAFGVTGFPWAVLNRSVKWNEVEASVLSLTELKSKVGVAIESSLSGASLSVKVKAKFSDDYSTSNLKYIVLLLEDGLIADQRNNADYGYGDADPLVDFVHDNVLRIVLTSSPFGEAIPSGSTKKGSIFEKSISYEIPDSYTKEKLEIVALIVKEDKSVINARHSSIGKTQTFEEL